MNKERIITCINFVILRNQEHFIVHIFAFQISRYFVVTAAHCVYGLAPSIYSVTVGEQHRTVPEFHEQTFAVADIRTHQNYQVIIVV